MFLLLAAVPISGRPLYGLYLDVNTNAALIDVDKMLTEEIYYWRGMAKADLDDWDGAAQDLRRAHLLNPNFLTAGKELQRIHSLGLDSSLDHTANPVLADLFSRHNSYFVTIAGSPIPGSVSKWAEDVL